MRSTISASSTSHSVATPNGGWARSRRVTHTTTPIISYLRVGEQLFAQVLADAVAEVAARGRVAQHVGEARLREVLRLTEPVPDKRSHRHPDRFTKLHAQPRESQFDRAIYDLLARDRRHVARQRAGRRGRHAPSLSEQRARGLDHARRETVSR